jgi:DNA polymerase III alpha subunit
MDDPRLFNYWNKTLYAGYSKINKHIQLDIPVDEFDRISQAKWNMPEQYNKFDIVGWLVEQCQTQQQINRVAQELVLYDERNLMSLLQFLKYMITMFREHNIVWGVGRGSSVSSYVLYLLGVHKVDSMMYNLDVADFLR